jgi:NADPH2 dehydrogenase
MLFKSIKVGQMELQHRVVMAPATRIRANEAHVPTPIMAEYYEQRSREKGTLLVTEATHIAQCAGGGKNVPGIWTEDQIRAWKQVSFVIPYWSNGLTILVLK